MNTRRYFCVAVLLSVCLTVVCPVIAVERTGGLIAAGTKWATPYYVVDSKVAGPVVMITGGMHGNEPAGARAAEHIRFWTIRRGKLIIAPRLNPAALAAGRRLIPGAPEGAGNLNRNFPKTGRQGKAIGAPAGAIWAFVKSARPDWLIDLHEGFAFHKSNPKSTGASIISLPELKLGDTVRLMLDAVNASVSDEGKKLVALRGSANGSLARSAAQKLGAKTMILETCYTDQYMSLRTRQHRLMVHRLLKHLKMAGCQSDCMSPAGGSVVRVAIYNGPGTGNSTGLNLEKVLCSRPGTLVRLVGPPDIAAGVLAGQFDAVIFGGGSGKGQAANIGAEGGKAVGEFVKGGGGYLGICGGAYLATSEYKWGLKIIDARTVDRKHWKRGKGKVKMELTKLGAAILGARDRTVEIIYANGPLLGPCGRKDLDDYEVLANFRGEINENKAPKGVMLNSPAMILGRFGSGKVILFSPHPEKTEALHGFVHRAVAHIARRRTKLPASRPISVGVGSGLRRTPMGV
ncbi:MAG: succinylglutamate desuccinylase/aspartoacylase family protein [Phycisphaerae bacterium]|nr:succinylglutamate desuccinylase/aspartoacylase family protein [Phycisphaerae bacterium]